MALNLHTWAMVMLVGSVAWRAPALGASHASDGPTPPPLPTRYIGVLVLPIVAEGVEGDLGGILTSALLDQIDELEGHEAISPQDALNAIAPYHLSVEACDRDVTCLARLGRYARAHIVLEARLSAPAGTSVLSVRSIDTENQAETDRVALYLAQDDQERLVQMQQVIVQLVTPDDYVGNFAIDCPNEHAEVYVDDSLLGYVPLPYSPELAAGTHILRVSKAGYVDVNRFIDVTYHRLTTVKVDLNDHTVAGVLVETHSTTGFGSLYVMSAVPGLEVRVDGEPKGVTILDTPFTGIAAGTHRISLRKTDSPPITQEITVAPDQRTDVRLVVDAQGSHLEVIGIGPATQPLPAMARTHGAAPPPQPMPLPPTTPFPTWRTYTALGLGVAAIGSFVAAYVLHRDIASYNAQADAVEASGHAASMEVSSLVALTHQLDHINAEGATANTWETVTVTAGTVFLLAGAGLLTWDFLNVQPVVAPSSSVAMQASFRW